MGKRKKNKKSSTTETVAITEDTKVINVEPISKTPVTTVVTNNDKDCDCDDDNDSSNIKIKGKGNNNEITIINQNTIIIQPGTYGLTPSNPIIPTNNQEPIVTYPQVQIGPLPTPKPTHRPSKKVSKNRKRTPFKKKPKYECDVCEPQSFVNIDTASIPGEDGWFFAYYRMPLPQDELIKGFKAVKYRKRISWSQANDYCQNNFGDTLASVHSLEEQYAFLGSMQMEGCDAAWNGMHNIKGGYYTNYQWADNSPITYYDFQGWLLQRSDPNSWDYDNPSVGYVQIIDLPIFDNGCKLFYWGDQCWDTPAFKCFVCQKKFEQPLPYLDQNTLGFKFHKLYRDVTYKYRHHHIRYIIIWSLIFLFGMFFYKMACKRIKKLQRAIYISNMDSDDECINNNNINIISDDEFNISKNTELMALNH